MISKIQLILKRFIDILLSVTGLVLLTVPFAIIALAIKLDSKGPVFFRQERSGRYGKPFTIYKFRTMTNARDIQGNLLSDTHRLTPFGRFLRGISLDELPELFNVLKGEMSLVGPRPLLIRYYPFFTDKERFRFSVRPGITGLALISGRNDLSWDRRIAADMQYVEKWTLWLDIKILFVTVWCVLTRRGLHVDPGANMLDFDEERRSRLQDGSGTT